MSHKHNEFRNRKYVLRFNKTHYGYFLNHSFRFLCQEQFSFFLQTIMFKSECKMNSVHCTVYTVYSAQCTLMYKYYAVAQGRYVRAPR